jgi:hypothetical protein
MTLDEINLGEALPTEGELIPRAWTKSVIFDGCLRLKAYFVAGRLRLKAIASAWLRRQGGTKQGPVAEKASSSRGDLAEKAALADRLTVDESEPDRQGDDRRKAVIIDAPQLTKPCCSGS